MHCTIPYPAVIGRPCAGRTGTRGPDCTKALRRANRGAFLFLMVPTPPGVISPHSTDIRQRRGSDALESIGHCWCGARIVNAHHCENGHLQTRDKFHAQ